MPGARAQSRLSFGEGFGNAVRLRLAPGEAWRQTENSGELKSSVRLAVKGVPVVGQPLDGAWRLD